MISAKWLSKFGPLYLIPAKVGNTGSKSNWPKLVFTLFHHVQCHNWASCLHGAKECILEALQQFAWQYIWVRWCCHLYSIFLRFSCLGHQPLRFRVLQIQKCILNTSWYIFKNVCMIMVRRYSLFHQKCLSKILLLLYWTRWALQTQSVP